MSAPTRPRSRAEAAGATRAESRPGMHRGLLALLLTAPVTVPVALILVAAFLISALAGGGSVTSSDVPATGVVAP